MSASATQGSHNKCCNKMNVSCSCFMLLQHLFYLIAARSGHLQENIVDCQRKCASTCSLLRKSSAKRRRSKVYPWCTDVSKWQYRLTTWQSALTSNGLRRMFMIACSSWNERAIYRASVYFTGQSRNCPRHRHDVALAIIEALLCQFS